MAHVEHAMQWPMSMTGRVIRSLLPLLALASLATACSSNVDDGTRTDASRIRRVSQGIVNGTPDKASDNAVVFISIGNQGDFCTGSLIAPNLVITAGHCVSDLDETVECGAFTKQFAPSTLKISVGVNPGGAVATATKIFVDKSKSTSSCSNDIALFQLDKDVPNAMIAKVRLTPLTVGEVARTAGYGDSGSGTPTQGRYEKTGIKIDSVGPASYTYKDKAGRSYPVSVPPGEIVTGESTCFGDSGGPLFDGAGNIIGVTSRGIDEKCIDRPSIYSDTASHAQFIKDAAVAAGHPLEEAPATPPTSGNSTGPRGTDPTGDPTTSDTSEDGSGDEDGDDSEGTTKAPAKKKPRGSFEVASSGCSAAPASTSSSWSFAVVALALGAVLKRRRASR